MGTDTNETETTLYRVLEVSPNATFEEIESAYERLMAYLAVDSMALYSMGVDPEDVGDQRARVEEAFRVLSDPQLRAAYDGARRGGEDYPAIVVPGSHSGGDPSLSAGRLADEYDGAGGAGGGFDEIDEAGAAFTEDVLARERAAREAVPDLGGLPSREPTFGETKAGSATSIAVPAPAAPTATPVGLATQATAVTTSGVVAPPTPAGDPAAIAPGSSPPPSAAPAVALLAAAPVATKGAAAAGLALASATSIGAATAAPPATSALAASAASIPSASAPLAVVSLAIGSSPAAAASPALAEAAAPPAEGLIPLAAAPAKAEPEASPTRRAEPAVLPAVTPAPLPRAETAPLPRTDPAPLPARRESVGPAPLPRDPAPVPVRVEPPAPKILPAGARDRARPGRQRLYPTEVPPTITAETEINGGVLKRLRESCHATLEEVATITKVNKRYLRAIEENDYKMLPAKVYVRGFVYEYARVLGLDPLLVANGFLRLLDRARPGKDG